MAGNNNNVTVHKLNEWMVRLHALDYVVRWKIICSLLAYLVDRLYSCRIPTYCVACSSSQWLHHSARPSLIFSSRLYREFRTPSSVRPCLQGMHRTYTLPPNSLGRYASMKWICPSKLASIFDHPPRGLHLDVQYGQTRLLQPTILSQYRVLTHLVTQFLLNSGSSS